MSSTGSTTSDGRKSIPVPKLQISTSANDSADEEIKTTPAAQLQLGAILEEFVEREIGDRIQRHEDDIWSAANSPVLTEFGEKKIKNPTQIMASMKQDHPHMRLEKKAKKTSALPASAADGDNEAVADSIKKEIVDLLKTKDRTVNPEDPDTKVPPKPGQTVGSVCARTYLGKKRDGDTAALDVDNILDEPVRPSKRAKATPPTTASKRGRGGEDSPAATPTKRRKVHEPNPEFARLTRGSRAQAVKEAKDIDPAVVLKQDIAAVKKIKKGNYKAFEPLPRPSSVHSNQYNDRSGAAPTKGYEGRELPKKMTNEYNTPQEVSSLRSTINMKAVPGSLFWRQEQEEQQRLFYEEFLLQQIAPPMIMPPTTVKTGRTQTQSEHSVTEGSPSSDCIFEQPAGPSTPSATPPTSEQTITPDSQQKRSRIVKLRVNFSMVPRATPTTSEQDVAAESSKKNGFTPINKQEPTPTPQPCRRSTRATAAPVDADAAKANDAVKEDTPPTDKTTEMTASEAAAFVTRASAQGKAKAGPTDPLIVGIATTMGTTIQRPADATLDEPWHCANRSCTSGQTWHTRDGPGSAFGRKVISNFFGRNKKETNNIHADVWHNYCRKDYQRSTYKVNTQSPAMKCKYYLDNIEIQLERIQLWRPEAKFKVQLSRGAQERLNKYCKELKNTGGDVGAARAAVTVLPGKSAKGKEKPLSLEDAFPIDLLDYFQEHFVTETESDDVDDLKNIVAWVRGKTESGEAETMPPMEFLINVQGDDEEVADPTKNYEMWVAKEDEEMMTEVEGEVEEETKMEGTNDDDDEE